MMGKALMAEASTTRFESVIAGIRGYLSEQLGELEHELDAARQSVAELNEQLAAKQSSIEVLVASRDLLLAKLNELDSALAESAVVTLPRQSRTETEQPAAPQAEAVAVTEAVETAAATPEADDATEQAPATKARKLNTGQRDVLAFLEATPGVHKVSEIATGVGGADAGNAAVQAVRRALAVLTEAGLATKSTQSGTAFYSTAATEVPAVATTTESTEAVEADEAPVEAPAAPVTRRARARKTAPAKAGTKQAGPKKTGPKKAAKRTPRAAAATTTVADTTDDTTSTPAAPARARKSRSAKGGAAVAKAPAAEAAVPAAAAEKSLRADRSKIVATLLAATEPQSAGEVSRTVMGDEWRTSDATNFRKVLKSMTAEGLVAEHLSDNNRTRYTATAGA